MNKKRTFTEYKDFNNKLFLLHRINKDAVQTDQSAGQADVKGVDGEIRRKLWENAKLSLNETKILHHESETPEIANKTDLWLE